MTEDLSRGDDIQLAQAAADGAANESQAQTAQNVVPVVRPPAGGEVIFGLAPGRVYDLRFDPRLAEVRVNDHDGDGADDMVLVFDAGTSQESRIVFKDMVEASQGENPPLLQSGLAYFGADVVIQQARALAGEQPTLETAAPAGPEAQGTGVTQYDDDLGTVIDLLAPQGVIPPVEMTFPSIEQTVLEDEVFDEATLDETPQVQVRIGAGAEFETVVIKEDDAGGFVADQFVGDESTLVNFSAVASNGFLTTIEITGFETLENWTFDASAVEAAIQNLGGSFSFDGTTLTVDLTDLGLTSLSRQFTATPPADSDADLGTLTVTVTAVSALDPEVTVSGTASTEVLVDAVLDRAIELGADGANGGAESVAEQTFSLNLDSSIVQPFAGSGNGGADTDGSESTVVLLTLDNPLPAGASLTSTAGTVTPTGNPNEFEIAGADLEAAIDGLQVTVPGGFDGTISGTVSTTSREANTPEGTVPASGAEPDETDNARTDSVNFAVTVEPNEVSPTAAIGLASGAAAIKEDSTDNLVAFQAASGDPTDELTSVVIDLPGVAPGDLDVSQIESEAGVASVVVSAAGGTTTITVNFEDAADLTVFNSSFTLDAPLEDSDVDIAGVTITANAKDSSDASQTAAGDFTTTIAVDAVLDERPRVFQADVPEVDEDGSGAQTVLLGLNFWMRDAGFAGSLDGGSDTDGSEAVTSVIISLSDGTLVFDAGYAGSASLTDEGGGNWTLSGWSDLVDLEAAVQALSVEVEAGFDGTVTGSITTTTQEANTPEGTVPASGAEPNTSDNAVTETFDFAMTVTPGGVAPSAAIGLASGAAAIKEDSTDNVIAFQAASGDASDELTSVVIELPGVAPGDLDVSQIENEAGVASVVVSEAGGTTTITVSFEDVADLTSFSSSFTLDAPVEDSDVDITGVTITANAKDITDASQTGSGDSSTTIVIDAVLDERPRIVQAVVPEVDEDNSGPQTIPLDLNFWMRDAGFAGSLDGGADTDGSEAVTSVTINLSDGTLVFDAGYTGSASLSDDGGGNWTLSGWSDLADLEAAVQALSVEVEAGFDGTVTGSITTTTREANTPAGTVPASGAEPNTSDNAVTETFDFSLIVDSVPTACDVAIAVDEDDLPAGNSDVAAGDDLADPSPTVIVGTLNFDFGADSAGGTVDFAALDGVAVADSGANPVTSNGVPLVYSWNAGSNTLTALAGATPVFTVVVSDPSTGDFTFSLLSVVDQPTAGSEDHIVIAMTFVATDGDGDTASGTLTVDIDDDTPQVVTADSALMANDEGGDTASGQLNFFESVGADRGSNAGVVFVNNEADNRLRGSIDGDPEVVLASGGHEVLLTGFGTTTLQGFVDLNDNGLIDDGAGSLVLQVDLNPDAGDESLDTYTLQLFGQIDNGQEIVFDDFSGISGNNNVFFPLNSSTDAGAPEDLLITATVPGTSTVNTDNDDIGTGDQWLDNDDTPADGEIIRLDYVENVTGDPDDMASLAYDHHYVVNDAGFRLSQLQSNDAIARSVLVRVYDEDDDPQGAAIDADPSVLQGDPAEQDDITSVRIERGTDDYVFLADGTQDGITVAFNPDGSVQIDGLFELDQVFIMTDDGYSQMEIQNVTSGGSNLGIALDNFVITAQQSGDPIDLSIDLEVTDSDGDTNGGTIDVTLLPQINGEPGDVDDVLESNGDAEILVGGLGDDTLTGGGEADIFVFNLGRDDGDDTITDFMSAEDRLQFTDVVDGAGDDIQDVDDMITAIVDDGAGDVQVNFTNGGSVVFQGIAFAAQTSIADLVDSEAQVIVDHA